MATILSSFDVSSPEHKTSLKIDVVEGLDQEHIDYMAQQWRPIMDRQRDAALREYALLPEPRDPDSWQKMLEKYGIPDHHWDWERKCAMPVGANRSVYGLLNGDHLEAAMLLAFDQTARLAPVGQPLIYVDYLAIAPWNRSPIQKPERFRRLGSLLLGAAVEISRVRNWDGRCGLHSIPSAESFYQAKGMQDLGADPSYEDMHYFEFDATSARTFTS